MKNIKAIRKSFLISAVYVGVATVSLIGQNTESIFYHDLLFLGIFITMPVSLPGFAIGFTERDSEGLILITQFVVFLITWRCLYLCIKPKTVAN